MSQVLICLAEVLRQNMEAKLDQIIKVGKASYGMDPYILERELQEFQRRQVLVERDGFYNCKVPLFREWLVDRGGK